MSILLSEHHAEAFDTVDLKTVELDPEVLRDVPGDLALRAQILPLHLDRFGNLLVAMGDPSSLAVVDELGATLRRPVVAVLADPAMLKEKIEEVFLERILSGLPGNAEETAGSADVFDAGTDLADLTKMASETAVVQMVNLIFAQAVRDGASDIHIEPYERTMKIRYRIDGMLGDLMAPPKRMHAALISRLKILGEMNIAERRLPQDGRIKLNIAGRSVDVRVSIIPTVFGERAVMRILDKGTAMMGLEELGMAPDTLGVFRKLIRQPYGIILVTGPTGSGKSTTLYAALQEILSPTTNILTIEDPVEYQVGGIGQIQVRPSIGLTFASGLRSIVRQDPDVIMVGEIRDHETAEIAIHAALTGHLVFSTLHTNDAAGAVTRLLDMGVEPYLAASSLIGVVAQRLVRRINPEAAEVYRPEPEALQTLAISDAEADDTRFRRPDPDFAGNPYRGRQGIHELLVVDETIKRMTVDRASASVMREHAIKAQNMRTLLGDGRRLVMQGATTPEEVLRVCQREDI